MARTPVWGIDIGQCALKALRCSVGENGLPVADAFDYIEYPQLLSQVEANPYQLVQEALKQFLSRNSLKHCRVALSVPGQSGLTKFIKLPPVEAKKIPDIVKYEAKQQIPFPLEDVIWDFQPMLVGGAAEGVVLESEVGLFAMKRDQVFRAIQPLEELEIELDIIQLAPLAIYNFVVHEIIRDITPAEEFDPDSPPPSLAVLALGTDTSDLVITNGHQVWQRNIPLGGNHFTKQLTKDLKITFAKAEHLKRNARQAEDAKTVFQAMRPVFSDLLTETQRSIAFFQNVNRRATLQRLVLLGNAAKLPGLHQYLEKNLELPTSRIESFERMEGEVVSAPSFQENVATYGPCYGLCLQALGLSRIRSNLLPREITLGRQVRAKKPWAVGAAAVLLLGLAVNYLFYNNLWWSAQPERSENQITWNQASSNVNAVAQLSKTHIDTADQKFKLLEQLDALGTAVVGNDERRLLWPELLKSVNEALPRRKEFENKSPKPSEYRFAEREELHIAYFESQYFDDLGLWFTGDVEKTYLQDEGLVGEEVATGASPPAKGLPLGARPSVVPALVPKAPVPGRPAGAGALPAAGAAATPTKPTGPGWVIQIGGYHTHNDRSSNITARAYVNETFRKALREGTVELPVGSSATGEPVKESFRFSELGVGYPVVVDNRQLARNTYVDPHAAPAAAVQPGNFAAPPPGEGAKTGEVEKHEVDEYHFTLQFCWVEKTLQERLKERREAEQQSQQNAAGTPGAAPGVNTSAATK